MTSNLFRLSWIIFFLVNSFQVQYTNSEKFGRCPIKTLDKKLCKRDIVDQCQNDTDCNGDSLCCSTGCNLFCMLPLFTACDHSQYFFEKQKKILKPDDVKNIHIPKCTESGNFQEIQCSNEGSGICWCVDGFGFEKGGTRAESRDKVNCTSTSEQCSGPQCRMLCPYGFELDSDGCEMCVCKDICRGVKCPGSLECQLQEVSCLTEPCPPVPTCKKPRTLDSLCPIGVPFTIPETGNPYLCGITPGKPTCPIGFKCNVNLGDEYGICCGSEAFYEKPGLCPVVSSASSICNDESGENGCQSACKHDLECPEMRKCCMTESRGKQCTDALNSTLCLQQKKIAEILSAKEIEGRGYIPQCDPHGDFLTKQCSRNGKICWCVDNNGRAISQSLSPAEFVNCNNTSWRRADVMNGLLNTACDINLCANSCEFGFKTDEVSGCQTCDCNMDPCASLNCQEGSKCTFVKPSDCERTLSCKFQPTCVSNILHVNPCDNGTPLFDHSSKQLVVCSENGPTCPSSHVCVKASVNTDGLCCLNLPRLEPTKPGMCPFISSSLCNGTSDLETNLKQCTSDKECEGDMKCCGLPCGAVCADPLLDAETESNKLPTTCQYLQTLELRQHEVLKNFKIAMNIHKCKESGEFDEIQCDGTNWCYCVDEFGIEISSTRVPIHETNNLTVAFCLEKRKLPNCLDMTCRLGCDFGYLIKDNCRICECVNPCNENTLCEADRYCEMVDTDCSEGYCPAVPYCIPRKYAGITTAETPISTKETINVVCPAGNPFFDAESNETLSCRPRARMLQCPDDYFCHELDGTRDFGYCCPILEFTAESSIVGKEENAAPILTNGNILDDISINRGTILTECERTRERQMEKVLESHRMNYIPNCNQVTGEWEPIQCLDEVNMCWCVNHLGNTVAGSMTHGKPLCNFRQSRGKFLGSTTKLDQPVCAVGKTIHVCKKSLCENKLCMAYPEATCGIDPCGGCEIKFYDQNNVVDCTVGLGKCQRDSLRIMNSPAWINQQKQNGGSSENDDDSSEAASIDHIIDDALQERVGRALPTGDDFPTVADLLAEVIMKQGSLEQFGEKISNIFLGNASPHPEPRSGSDRTRTPGGSLPNFHRTPGIFPQSFNGNMPMTLKASCPQPSPDAILFRLTGTCIDLCNYDDECHHDERCCLVDCGYTCHKVAVEYQVEMVQKGRETIDSLESVIGDDFEEAMFLNPPTCKENGDFHPQQSQGDLMWCVDSDGRPQPDSFTRGFVVCSKKGLIEKRSIGNICPNSAKLPMVCTDECLKFECGTHPDAICVADPCDNCKVTFYTPSGDKVLCENKCHQKMDNGICRASFVRYFYNSTSSQCEEFLWGGCQGNENKFETMSDCRNSCERQADVCSLTLKFEVCTEETERFYFDTVSDSCQKFSGCPGDGNNFKTKNQCESHCPIRVLCPNIVDGSLSICNRAEACENATKDCGHFRTDDYICNVEPCSCTAELKYLDGRTVLCEVVEASTSREVAKKITEVSIETTEEGPSARNNLDNEGISLPLDDGNKEQEGVSTRDSIITAFGVKLLSIKPGFPETKSRCQNMKKKYLSKCDERGNFVPTQCSVDEPVCWCVDSAGNQVEGTTTFLAGSSTCAEVIIEKVNVRLSFSDSSSEDISEVQLGTEIQDLLRRLDASLETNKVSVENVEGLLNVDFVLIGESSVHVAYLLEEGLKRSLLGISVQNQFIPADLSTSRFHYVVTQVPTTTSLPDTTSTVEENLENITIEPEANFVIDDSVTAQVVNPPNEDLNIMAIVLTVVAAITAVLIILGLFLGLQNKKVMGGNKPKNRFRSLPFTSTFEFERKGFDTKSSKS